MRVCLFLICAVVSVAMAGKCPSAVHYGDDIGTMKDVVDKECKSGYTHCAQTRGDLPKGLVEVLKCMEPAICTGEDRGCRETTELSRANQVQTNQMITCCFPIAEAADRSKYPLKDFPKSAPKFEDAGKWNDATTFLPMTFASIPCIVILLQ